MSAATGITQSAKLAGTHAVDAVKGTAVAGKDMFMNANSRLSGHIADKGVWGTVKHGATKYPLITGAAIVTGGYVAATKVMGPKEQRLAEQRAAQEQGLQR